MCKHKYQLIKISIITLFLQLTRQNEIKVRNWHKLSHGRASPSASSSWKQTTCAINQPAGCQPLLWCQLISVFASSADVNSTHRDELYFTHRELWHAKCSPRQHCVIASWSIDTEIHWANKARRHIRFTSNWNLLKRVN